MIDLRNDFVLVEEFLRNGITEFRSNVAEPTWIGVYSCPHYGWVMLCFDTTNKFDEKELNCPDFGHVEFSVLEMSHWDEASEIAGDLEYEDCEKGIVRDEYLSLLDHTGEIISIGSELGGDEFDYPFFRMLKAATRKIKREANTYKFVVQVLDSKFIEKI